MVTISLLDLWVQVGMSGTKRCDHVLRLATVALVNVLPSGGESD